MRAEILNSKASIPIEFCWMAAVQHHSALMGDKHGYARSILTGIEDLTGFKLIGVELQRRFKNRCALAGGNIVSKYG